MHAAHRNKPVEDSKLDEMLSEIDRKLEALDELQERKARSKNRKYCRACGNTSEPEAVYCGHCGAPFEAEAETEPKTEGTQASE